MPSRSASKPGGTACRVRSSQADTCAVGAWRRASPSGERHQDDAAARDLRRPHPYVAVPARPEHPLDEQFTGEVKPTGWAEPMWKVTWTA